jgi:hypothetical protein
VPLLSYDIVARIEAVARCNVAGCTLQRLNVQLATVQRTTGMAILETGDTQVIRGMGHVYAEADNDKAGAEP